jgi:hypothetical protein
MCGKDLLLSNNTGYQDQVSYSSKVPDVANMIYFKKFWNAYTFDGHIDDANVLVYNYIYFRKNCVTTIPFLHWSFKIADSCNTKYVNTSELGYSLENLIPRSSKESYYLMLTKQ